MENFKNVEKFYDYLIINDDGWAGIKEDAPEEAKKAYDEYMRKEKELSEEGIKI